jgi:hypothetical protein
MKEEFDINQGKISNNFLYLSLVSTLQQRLKNPNT